MMTVLKVQDYKFIRIIAAFLLIFVGNNSFVRAGEKTSPERGFNPGNSYAISDIETIGLQSGNLMLNLPFGSLPRVAAA